MVEPRSKIISIDDLKGRMKGLRKEGKRIVLCHGAFDLIHPGHIRFLERARSLGEVLVVSMLPDHMIDKGPGRPVFNERLRGESLAALQSVDFVLRSAHPSAAEMITLLGPDVFVTGTALDADQTEPLGPGLDEAAHSVGAELHVTDDVAFSSTRLLNSYFEVLTTEAQGFLREFARTHRGSDIIKHLRSTKDAKVLVIGDCIIDEYHVCSVMGRSSKSPSLNARFLYAEAHAGGAVAIANHLAGYSGDVHLVSGVGANDDHRDFVMSKLHDGVTARLFTRPDAPTTVKRRYTTPYTNRIVFEVTFIDDRPMPDPIADELNEYLASVLPEYDMVVVGDFGHGLINPKTVDLICDHARFLALNVQTNSANTGFNLLTKYPKADYICIDQEEIRLAYHDRFGSLRSLIERAGQDFGARMISVTRGEKGAVTYSSDGTWTETPAFSRQVIDAVGAGDAFLSLSALCAGTGRTAEFVGFVGNSAAALAIRVLGNRESVEPERLERLIDALLT